MKMISKMKTTPKIKRTSKMKTVPGPSLNNLSRACFSREEEGGVPSIPWLVAQLLQLYNVCYLIKSIWLFTFSHKYLKFRNNHEDPIRKDADFCLPYLLNQKIISNFIWIVQFILNCMNIILRLVFNKLESIGTFINTKI